MSEAQAFNDQWAGVEASDHNSIYYIHTNTSGVVEVMKERYRAAEAAKIGATIRCACCGRKIKKTTYHKRFCSNGKTKKGGNCKDRYWNTVVDTRRERATIYS